MTSFPVERRRKVQEVRTKGRVSTGRLNLRKMGERAEWSVTVQKTAKRWTGRDLEDVQEVRRS